MGSESCDARVSRGAVQNAGPWLTKCSALDMARQGTARRPAYVGRSCGNYNGIRTGRCSKHHLISARARCTLCPARRGTLSRGNQGLLGHSASKAESHPIAPSATNRRAHECLYTRFRGGQYPWSTELRTSALRTMHGGFRYPTQYLIIYRRHHLRRYHRSRLTICPDIL